MNKEQEYLLDILSVAIRNKNILIKDNDIDLQKVFDEAKNHKVSELIYSALDKESKLAKENKEIINKAKKDTIFSAINQVNHVKKISKVLEEFNNNNIPVITLKGLVVRYFYPKPDLRTMSDADLLVHKEDLHKVRSMFEKLGYYEIEESKEHGAPHIVFVNSNTVIEVHWSLINRELFNGNTSFESDLWNNAINVKVGQIDTLSLGLEDLVLHLCIHMAVHFAYSGFGLRQLCDLVVLVENKGKLIDWELFLKRAKSANIEKFSFSIFNIANKLFNMNIPEDLKDVKKLDNSFIETLIDEIFNGGVKDKTCYFTNFLAFKAKDNGIKNKLKRFVRLLFPPINEMSSTYDYAKKYRILSLIAWIHHLINGFRNKGYNFKEKIKIITNTVPEANRKSNLMEWLEL